LLQAQPRDTDDRFYYNVHKMELERVKYTLKSYLRTRLFKIERFLLYLVEKDQAALLSEGEMAYAWTLYESKKAHFNQTFLAKLPSKLNPFETPSETVDDKLITKPNEQEFVFVRFLRDHERYMLNIEIEVRIKAGQVYFLPYIAAREFCERGEAELL
jgi:GINS complex subunit 4